MLNVEQKHAIENLLILADYIKEHAIYSDEYKEIIDESIRVAEIAIGKPPTKSEAEGDCLGENTEEFILKALEKRFKT